MKNFVKVLSFSIVIITFFSFGFGQEMTAKQKEILEKFKQKEALEEAKRKEFEETVKLLKKKFKYKAPKNEEDILWQNRLISDYLNGGSVDCGNIGFFYKCDFSKLRQFIWDNWNKKNRAYFSWGFCGIDYCYTEHFFIEPNKNNQWLIVSYNPHSQKKPIKKLSEAHIVEWAEDKDEKIIVLKDKSGKIVEKF